MLKIEEQYRDFIHPVLNQEHRAMAGYYLFTEEVRLPFQEREILYFVGHAVLDSACCGKGEIYYALVPGYIVKWKYRQNEEDRSVSMVEAIRDGETQNTIRCILKEKELVSQINFD